MPVAAAAPPTPPIRVELVTITLYTTVENDVPYTVAIAIDKGYRVREGLNNPVQKYPIPHYINTSSDGEINSDIYRAMSLAVSQWISGYFKLNNINAKF
jgi:hypothetical protein